MGWILDHPNFLSPFYLLLNRKLHSGRMLLLAADHANASDCVLGFQDDNVAPLWLTLELKGLIRNFINLLLIRTKVYII